MDRIKWPTWQAVCQFYDSLTLHAVPGPRSFSYFLPILLTIAALVTPPGLLSRRQIHWILIPLIYMIQLYVWVKHKSFDVISMNFALSGFELLGWYDVRYDFRYVRRLRPKSPEHSWSRKHLNSKAEEANEGETSGSGNQTQNVVPQPPFVLEPYPEFVTSRFRWVGILLLSMRLTDWHIGLPSHDSRQPSALRPFSDFVLETVTHSVIAYVLLCITSPYMVATSCGTDPANLTTGNLWNNMTQSLILLGHFYAALSLLTALLPHLVSIGALVFMPSLRSESLVSPLTWPSHFGPLSSIYSKSSISPNRGLRAFWGVFWHQNMRHVTSTPGIALTSALNIARGSKLRYMVLVASGFFWSGVIHMGVIPPEPLGTKSSCWEMRFRIASFFWLQIVGIAIEEVVESLGRKADPRQEKKRLDGAEKTSVWTGDVDGTVTKDDSSSLVSKIAILTWTVGFLASTAWWTVLPVGCEMGWLKIKLIPITYFRYTDVR